MRNLIQVMLGLILGAILLAALYLIPPGILAPKVSHSIPPGIAAPAGKPPATATFLDGHVLVPPALRAILSTRPDAVVTFFAHPEGAEAVLGDSDNMLVNASDLLVSGFPIYFHARVRPDVMRWLAHEKSALVNLTARVCYDRKANAGLPEPCRPTSRPNMIANLRFLFDTSAVIASEKGFGTLEAPPLFLNRHLAQIENTSCATPPSIEGQVLATDAFRNGRPPGRLLLFAVPFGERHPPPPFFSPAFTPVSPEQLNRLGDVGISWTPLTLAGTGETPFRIPIPEKFRDAYFNLFVQACPPELGDLDCLREGLPVYSSPNSRNDNTTRFQLVGESFQQSRCGLKGHIFYLHKWRTDGITNVESAMERARPGELVEGSFGPP